MTDKLKRPVSARLLNDAKHNKDSSSPARRSSGRRSVPPRNSSETLAPTPGVKRSIVVKKIVARKTQVTGSSPAVRRSPRVSPSNKENTKRASGSELCQPAQPAPPSAKVRLLSPVLPASSSPARGHAKRASGAKARVRSSAQSPPPPPPPPPRPATPLSPILPPNPAAPPSSSSSPAQSHAKRASGAKTRVRGSPLSPILPPRPAAPPSPQNEPPAQPDPDPGDLLWSQKVRRSYSRLSDSGAASPPPSSSSSSSPAPRRCSLFGFRRLLTPERPPAETTWVSAGSATLLDATSAPEPGQPDPHIPGVALVKERKRKKKVPQIKMSELDHLAAQLNAEFEEAEKFDLVFE